MVRLEKEGWRPPVSFVSLAAEREVSRLRVDQEAGRLPVMPLSPDTLSEVSLLRVDHSLGSVPEEQTGRVSHGVPVHMNKHTDL